MRSLFSFGFLVGGILTSSQIKLTSATGNSHYSDHEISEFLALVENENPLCARWDDDICSECAPRAYFNQDGICVQVDPQCKNFDSKMKRCTNCYTGYQIIDGKCYLQRAKVEEDWALGNPLCASWVNKKCVKCSPQSYFNFDKVCVMVNPDCKTYMQSNGNCLSCFSGYELDKSGGCTKSENDWKNKDPLCSKWDSIGNCTQCAPKTFKNSQGNCQQVDPNCFTHSSNTGECTSCYKGYGLKNGKCIEEVSSLVSTNPYCARWENSKCMKCAVRTYPNTKTGICTVANPLCKTFTETNGDCTSCYPGFQISEGKCIQAKNNYAQSNPLCSQWLNQKCVRCASRSYFNENGICKTVDPNCATFSQKSGECYTCYVGYEVSNGKCLLKNVESSTSYLSRNPLCSQWKAQTCIKCGTRSYFEDNGICTEIDPYCKQFSEEKRICTKCYSGYKLKSNLKGCVFSGTVQRPPQVVLQNTRNYDVNCKKYNASENLCEECLYDLVPAYNKCFKMQIDSSLDPQKCMKWRGGKCLQCSKGLSVNNITGLCVCM